MSHETYALISLAFVLLGVIITSTWKFATINSHVTDKLENIENKEKELNRKLEIIESIPELKAAVAQLQKNHSLIPKLMSRTDVIETKLEHSKEMRKVLMRQSRPDSGDKNE